MNLDEQNATYLGWKLYWTGWKSEKSLYRVHPLQSIPVHCFTCGQAFVDNDEIWQDFCKAWGIKHWKCHGEPDYICGQWVGSWHMKNPARPVSTFYASTPGGEGRIVRGEAFNIEPVAGQQQWTGDMPDFVLNEQKDETLERLRKLIYTWWRTRERQGLTYQIG